MDITLTLVGLHHKQIGHMAGDMILVAGSVATEDFLQTNANVSKATQKEKRTEKHTFWN